MDNAFKEALLEHLLDCYERANTSGESALNLGIGYSVLNKTFSIDFNGASQQLSANYVADFTEGGDALVEDMKRWARGGKMN